MENKQESEGSAALLILSIDDLFKEAYSAVENKDLRKLNDIDILVKRHYSQKIARCQMQKLEHFCKLLVHFLTWFEWGGQLKWEKAIPIVNQFKTILELSQLILETESPKKAFKVLSASRYGIPLVEILNEKKLMKPSEIRDALNIKTMQQVSNLLSNFEKAGIIIREIEGKNVWVSLGISGMAAYREYLQPAAEFLRKTIDVLRSIGNKNFDEAEKALLKLNRNEPDNPFIICLLGLVSMEKNNLGEAGKRLTKAVKLGFDQIDKRRAYLFLYILENMNRLNRFRDRLVEINLCGDELTPKIKPTLRLLALLYEYKGNMSRAKEYYRLA